MKICNLEEKIVKLQCMIYTMASYIALYETFKKNFSEFLVKNSVVI